MDSMVLDCGTDQLNDDHHDQPYHSCRPHCRRCSIVQRHLETNSPAVGPEVCSVRTFGTLLKMIYEVTWLALTRCSVLLKFAERVFGTRFKKGPSAREERLLPSKVW